MHAGDGGRIVADLRKDLASEVGVKLPKIVFPLVITDPGCGILGTRNCPAADVLRAGSKLQWLGGCRFKTEQPIGEPLGIEQLASDGLLIDDLNVWITRIFGVDERDGLLKARVHARG